MLGEYSCTLPQLSRVAWRGLSFYGQVFLSCLWIQKFGQTTPSPPLSETLMVHPSSWPVSYCLQYSRGAT